MKFYEGDSGTLVEDFTDSEAEKLKNYVTDAESNVFAWKISNDFTPEQSGALLSRYSRTTLTGRRLLLNEFLPNKNRGREFFEAWLVDFGDDSIQEMAGGLPVSCEFVSNVMAKDIEDCRIGSYIEKSSRYVPFDKKFSNGEFMFYKDPDIMNSRFSDDYLALMKNLFESYVKFIDPMVRYISELNPFNDQVFKIGDSLVKPSEINKKTEEAYGVSEADVKKAYDNSVRSNALDLLRDYLPMSTLTHVGINMNARSYENLMIKLASSPLTEAKWISKRIHKELNKVAPSLVRRIYEKHGVEFQKFLSERNSKTLSIADGIVKDLTVDNSENVDLIEFSGMKEENPDYYTQVQLASIILYKYSQGQSLRQLIEKTRKMSEEQRKTIIKTYVGDRVNRRHKPGRAFENIEYLFDITGRTGIYRDLQRHRIGTQERQNFTVKLGYDMRSEFEKIGIKDNYKSLMSRVVELHDKIHEKMPWQAQYVVTFGFNARWYYRFNARQLFHFGELRTTPAGHPDYRRLVQKAYYKIKDVHPTIASHMNFINLEDKRLGRLQSEIRIAAKRKALQK
ncbi:MAG: FAD-dependent thymidylate synthase [Candidatus Marsarchaeota archaeon]|nr:FAD-dependent thymidylate synthase [Candidatus Marsarchaeota archaeon]